MRTPDVNGSGCIAELRRVERDDFSELHLTFRGHRTLPPAAAAERIYAELGDALAELGVQVLQEKVYGPLQQRRRTLEVRAQALSSRGLDSEIPCTFVAGRPLGDGALSGAQVYGVLPRRDRGVTVTTVQSGAGVAGRLLQAPRYRLLFLSSIRGTEVDGSLAATAERQAECMFERAEAALDACGMAFVDVTRTWIYLRDLLAWYGEFNQLRTAFLNQRGITGGADGRPFPASTGIQGSGDGEECMMDLCAVDAAPGAGVAVAPVLGSSRQQQAFGYGSSFSRGAALQLGGRKTVFVSGTASIDAGGRSLHCGDRRAQVLETLDCVEALLEREGSTLADICSATVFAKDAAALDAFEAIARQRLLENLPYVSVLADVCRPELLVEIEALAVVGAGRRS